MKIHRSLLLALFPTCSCFSSNSYSTFGARDDRTLAINAVVSASASSWFPNPSYISGDEIIQETEAPDMTIYQLKAQILQLGAALDRGQAYNPTSGPYYEKNMAIAKQKILQLLDMAGGKNVPEEGNLESVAGEWELVLTTVKHGIFRSSPFFLAIQEAFSYAEESG